jgi:hypothetical protein
MLDDTSRKVLRILYNLYRYDDFKLEIETLARYAMRSERQIKDAINTLVKDKYLVKDQGVFMISKNKQSF